MSEVSYLDLVIIFWQKDIEHNFSPNEVALYFFLLKTANGAHWKNPFGLSNAITMAKFGIGKTSFDTAKRNLKAAGLIDFRAGDGRGNVYQYALTKDSKPIKFSLKGHGKVSQKRPLSDNLSTTLSETLSDRKPDTSIDNRSRGKTKTVSDANASASAGKKQDAEQSSLHTTCIAIYETFLQARETVSKLDGRERKAMNEIIAHLSKEARIKNPERPQSEVEERVKANWQGILDSWGMLSNYHQGRLKLSEINDQLTNILTAIKNGTNGKAGNAAGNGKTGTGNQAGALRNRGASIDELQALKRNRGSDGEERTEFTDAEVV